uniref:(northern house mosquito) hypothetical protein n=1 Tax=Culex pipiens TaxID=7175 RepID=A0A8D8JVS3_CULPI
MGIFSTRLFRATSSSSPTLFRPMQFSRCSHFQHCNYGAFSDSLFVVVVVVEHFFFSKLTQTQHTDSAVENQVEEFLASWVENRVRRQKKQKKTTSKMLFRLFWRLS